MYDFTVVMTRCAQCQLSEFHKLDQTKLLTTILRFLSPIHPMLSIGL